MDKAYKQAIFEAIKEVMAFVEPAAERVRLQTDVGGGILTGSVLASITGWTGWRMFTEIMTHRKVSMFLTRKTGLIHTTKGGHQFSYHHLPIIGLSLERNLLAAYRSFLFCESVRIYYRVSSDIYCILFRRPELEK
jgi:hypothetical protein